MKPSVALLVSSVVSAALGQRCGPGTYHDDKSGMCLVGAEPPAGRERRAGNGAAIESKNGNVVIAVNEQGKQIGYRIGDVVRYFDDMDKNILGQIPALDLGYELGQAASGSHDILKYLKEDLSGRVEKINDAQGEIEASVQRSVSAAKTETTLQLEKAAASTTKQLADQKKEVAGTIDSLSTKVTNDLKTTKEEIDESVAKKTDKLSNVDKKLTCLNLNQKFNPATGECCPPSFVWDVKTGKCKELPRLGATVGNPGSNCRDIMKFYEVTRIGVPKDGLFFLAPGGIATFQTWCTFKGEYKGAALAMRKPGRINSMQKKTGALGGACTPTGGTKPNSIKYCKISDAQINALKKVSTEIDPYIALSYKGSGPDIYCRSFAAQQCNWDMNGNDQGKCRNSICRNSGRYCDQGNRNSGYRGIDGYICNNLDWRDSCNKFRDKNNVAENYRPFMIFEHGGGSHYCGGHDTTWNRIELWIQ